MFSDKVHIKLKLDPPFPVLLPTRGNGTDDGFSFFHQVHFYSHIFRYSKMLQNYEKKKT